MTKDEALDLALEFFETMQRYKGTRSNIFIKFEPTATGDYVDLREFDEKAKPIITAIKQALAAPVQEPVAIIEQLWAIIDDIDTYGDMAKSDDKLYRGMVERRQKDRWKTGITTDGYTLNVPRPPAAQPAMRQVGVVEPLMGTMRTVIWDEGTIPSAGTTLWAKDE